MKKPTENEIQEEIARLRSHNNSVSELSEGYTCTDGLLRAAAIQNLQKAEIESGPSDIPPPSGFAGNTGFFQSDVGDLSGQDCGILKPARTPNAGRANRQFERFFMTLNPGQSGL